MSGIKLTAMNLVFCSVLVQLKERMHNKNAPPPEYSERGKTVSQQKYSRDREYCCVIFLSICSEDIYGYNE